MTVLGRAGAGGFELKVLFFLWAQHGFRLVQMCAVVPHRDRSALGAFTVCLVRFPSQSP